MIVQIDHFTSNEPYYHCRGPVWTYDANEWKQTPEREKSDHLVAGHKILIDFDREVEQTILNAFLVFPDQHSERLVKIAINTIGLEKWISFFIFINEKMRNVSFLNLASTKYIQATLNPNVSCDVWKSVLALDKNQLLVNRVIGL